MRTAALVNDADVVCIRPRDAGIALAFVEQQVQLAGPRAAVIQAHLNRVVRPAFLLMGIGEQQQGFAIHPVQAAVASRFNQRVSVGSILSAAESSSTVSMPVPPSVHATERRLMGSSPLTFTTSSSNSLWSLRIRTGCTRCVSVTVTAPLQRAAKLHSVMDRRAILNNT